MLTSCLTFRRPEQRSSSLDGTISSYLVRWAAPFQVAATSFRTFVSSTWPTSTTVARSGAQERSKWRKQSWSFTIQGNRRSVGRCRVFVDMDTTTTCSRLSVDAGVRRGTASTPSDVLMQRCSSSSCSRRLSEPARRGRGTRNHQGQDGRTITFRQVFSATFIVTDYRQFDFCYFNYRHFEYYRYFVISIIISTLIIVAWSILIDVGRFSWFLWSPEI